MKLMLNRSAGEQYKSTSQKARVMTELWVKCNAYCPSCGRDNVATFPNNSPVADFFCDRCKEEFELKSSQQEAKRKIVDGAYQTMIERLQAANNPSLFFLHYDLPSLSVNNFFVIPKCFFIPQLIERRKPLRPKARRAGWVGCNILLQKIPSAGRIYLIKNRDILPKESVLSQWQKTSFLSDAIKTVTKGWLLDIMLCIEETNRPIFSLDEMYTFEHDLMAKHPDNRHIRAKIRQQLQLLRDKGYLQFLGCGKYKVI